MAAPVSSSRALGGVGAAGADAGADNGTGMPWARDGVSHIAGHQVWRDVLSFASKVGDAELTNMSMHR